MNFSKTFLAGLLAFVVGNILIAVLWSLFVMGDRRCAVGDDRHRRQFDSADRPFGEHRRGASRRSFRWRRFPYDDCHAPRDPVRALRAIDAAKSDPRIKGIYIRPNGQGTVSMAVLEELRAAILDFKQESGKFVLAYNEAYGQGGYYLATAADGVYLQPEGLLDWHGMAVNTLFFKGLLDKLDLKVEVFRPTACKYKSAVEPYILTKLSDANREQLGQLVHSMWSVIAGDVAESRGLTIEMLDEYADELSAIQPEDALAKGMVDGLKYEDEMNDLFAEAGVEADGDGQYRFVSLGRYAAQVGPDMRHMGADRVAVLYADGQIVDGEGYDAVYGNTLAEKIRAAAAGRWGEGGRRAGEFARRQRSGLGRDLARNGTAQSRKTGDRFDGRLCSQRRVLHLRSGGCHRGRPAHADGFDRRIRHVARCGRRHGAEIGRHCRCGQEQPLGRFEHLPRTDFD